MSFMENELIAALVAQKGATSPITSREATGDKSVTLDKTEKEVLKVSYPTMDFPRKGAGNRNETSREFDFFVHPFNNLTDSNLRKVSIVFPKREGNELRLYFSNSSGFTIDSNSFQEKSGNGENPHWYIFVRAGESYPHIGMADLAFLNEYTLMENLLEREDAEDTSFQAALQNEVGGKRVSTSSSKFPRSTKESALSLAEANYTCEVDASHKTFKSSVSGKPYLEGHHLIPLSLQDQYPLNIDIKENIVALCPNCHRLLHHGIDTEKRDVLTKLWSERKNRLAEKGIEVSNSTFYDYYQC